MCHLLVYNHTHGRAGTHTHTHEHTTVWPIIFYQICHTSVGICPHEFTIWDMLHIPTLYQNTTANMRPYSVLNTQTREGTELLRGTQLNKQANSANLILLLVSRYMDSVCARVATHPKTNHQSNIRHQTAATQVCDTLLSKDTHKREKCPQKGSRCCGRAVFLKQVGI